MKVKLISYSQPVSKETEDAQDLIAYCARVSNPTNQNNSETSERLLTYLAKEKHWSPFEMVSACLEIETTRDIARQILRHRSFSFQEFSQRYANPDEAFANTFETREARMQDKKNRQNSIVVDDIHLQLRWASAQSRVQKEAETAYKWAIDNGVAKEQARVVLPEGNTISRLYMNGTLRSWIHYIQLRSANGTQAEHRDIAIECAVVLKDIFPIITKFIN